MAGAETTQEAGSSAKAVLGQGDLAQAALPDKEALRKEAAEKMAALRQAAAAVAALKSALDATIPKVQGRDESAGQGHDEAGRPGFAAGVMPMPEAAAAASVVASEVSGQPDQRRRQIDNKVEQFLGLSQKGKVETGDTPGGIFWQAFGIMVAIFLVLIGAGLGYLWQTLAAYEVSTPEYALATHLPPLIQGGLPQLFVQEASSPGTYESSTEKDSFIRALLADGELTYQRLPGGDGTGAEVYLYKAGAQPMAAVTMTKTGPGRFGSWETVAVDYCMPTYGELQIYAPVDAELSINGRKPAIEDLVDEAAYEELANLPQDLIKLPHQNVYRIAGLYRQPEILAQGFAGNELKVVWEEDHLVRVLPVVPEEEGETIREMALADAQTYSFYTSRDAEFSALARRMIRGTAIYDHMRTMETIFYTDHVAVKFADGLADNIRLYTPDCLAVDIEYNYFVYRSGGREYAFPTKVTFFYLKVDEKWLIGDIAIR